MNYARMYLPVPTCPPNDKCLMHMHHDSFYSGRNRCWKHKQIMAANYERTQPLREVLQKKIEVLLRRPEVVLVRVVVVDEEETRRGYILVTRDVQVPSRVLTGRLATRSRSRGTSGFFKTSVSSDALPWLCVAVSSPSTTFFSHTSKLDGFMKVAKTCYFDILLTGSKAVRYVFY